MPVNYQVSADNDYSTDEKHRISWKNMTLDGYISSRKLSRKEKNRNLSEKPFFQKINYQLWSRKWWPISSPPLVNHYRKKSEYQYKNKTRITHWTKECKKLPSTRILQ